VGGRSDSARACTGCSNVPDRVTTQDSPFVTRSASQVRKHQATLAHVGLLIPLASSRSDDLYVYFTDQLSMVDSIYNIG
jgi:hypothetical protein